MKKRELTVVGFALTCFLGACPSTTAQGGQRNLERRRRLEVNQQTLPYTKRLPPVDKVELVEIGSTSEGGDIRSISAVKIVEAKQARAIASIWRLQAFDLNYSAACHEPPYAIKFYSRGKVVLYASICWGCRNIVILEPIVSGQGSYSNGRVGKALLRIFTDAFPKHA